MPCIYCSHCGQHLARRTYREHYEKYWDGEAGQWKQTTHSMPKTPASLPEDPVPDSARTHINRVPWKTVGGKLLGFGMSAQPRSAEVTGDVGDVSIKDDKIDDDVDRDSAVAAAAHGERHRKAEEIEEDENDGKGSNNDEEDVNDNDESEEDDDTEEDVKNDDIQIPYIDLESAPEPTGPGSSYTLDPSVNLRSQACVQGEHVGKKLCFFLLFLHVWMFLNNITRNAMASLLSVLAYFNKELCNVTPTVLETAAGCRIHKDDDFIKDVVCPQCGKISKEGKFADAENKPLKCECGAELAHTTTLLIKNQKRKVLTPILLFPRKSVKTYLAQMFRRPGFQQQIQHWREREVPPNILTDIYDGQVWKRFIGYNLFNQKPDYEGVGFMLNYDGFQPFVRGTYSVGAIYLVNCNLPRRVRFLRKNIMLVGLTPGGREYNCDEGPRKRTIDHILRPLVDELIELWETGIDVISVDSEGNERQINVRAALICVACDLPACRKMLGELSYNAHRGCNKCWSYDCLGNGKNVVVKEGTGDLHCYLAAKPRTNEEQRKLSKDYETLCGEVDRDYIPVQRLLEFVQETGVRSTQLNRLPYFDRVSMTVVDPLHNLYLGIAKHFMAKLSSIQLPVNIDGAAEKLVKSTSEETESKSSTSKKKRRRVENPDERRKVLLGKRELSLMQKEMNRLQEYIPSGIGTIPRKIQSNMADFTGDEWRNFTLIFSPYLLRFLREKSDIGVKLYKGWLQFVSACKIFNARIIHISDLDVAQNYLINFLRIYEEVFGIRECVPNLHMSIHLKESLINFGPIYAFWCFTFERYNGFLKNRTRNNKHAMIPVEMMRSFTRLQLSENIPFRLVRAYAFSDAEWIVFNRLTVADTKQDDRPENKQIQQLDESIDQFLSTALSVLRLAREGDQCTGSEEIGAKLLEPKEYRYQDIVKGYPNRKPEDCIRQAVWRFVHRSNGTNEETATVVCEFPNGPSHLRAKRLRLFDETLSSNMRSRPKGSYVLAVFATPNTNNKAQYPCQIEYFLEIMLRIKVSYPKNEQPATENTAKFLLAKVCWATKTDNVTQTIKTKVSPWSSSHLRLRVTETSPLLARFPLICPVFDKIDPLTQAGNAWHPDDFIPVQSIAQQFIPVPLDEKQSIFTALPVPRRVGI